MIVGRYLYSIDYKQIDHLFDNFITKMSVNFSAFDPDELFASAHVIPATSVKRSADGADMDPHLMMAGHYGKKKEDKLSHIHGAKSSHQSKAMLSNGKKTKGRVKIKMEFIDNKLRRYTTFSKRKTGIMKKAYELSTLTGTQVMLLVASETGHVYTFATRKLQPMITSEAGKALIQTCLNSPDPPNGSNSSMSHDQRMSATGYEETELTYAVPEDGDIKGSPTPEDFLNGNASCSGSESSMPPSPSNTPALSPLPCSSEVISHSLTNQLQPGIIFTSSASEQLTVPVQQSPNPPRLIMPVCSVAKSHIVLSTPAITINKGNLLSGGNILTGGANRGVVYAAGGGVVYATPTSCEPSSRLLASLPSGLQLTDSSSDPDNRNQTELVNFPIHLASAALQKAAASVTSSNNHQALPTDLSMHIKRESRS